MKRFSIVLFIFFVVISPTLTRAAGNDPLTREEMAADDVKDRPEWLTTTQAKFNLTDEQIKAMTEKNITGPGLAITAGLAAKSGKTVQEVAALRTDKKMEWGKIAEKLAVDPSALSQDVANMRHDIRDAHHEVQMMKKQKRKLRVKKK